MKHPWMNFPVNYAPVEFDIISLITRKWSCKALNTCLIQVTQSTKQNKTSEKKMEFLLRIHCLHFKSDYRESVFVVVKNSLTQERTFRTTENKD